MVWTTKDLFAEINDTYLESLDTMYKTGFSFLEDEEPEKAVNQWVSEVTNNKIKKLYDELPGTISLLLTNALWFKDSWNQPFDEVLEPERKDYFLSNGSKIQVEMMERTSYGFVVSDVFQFTGLKHKVT
jgi:serine protease inhibitor